MPPVSVTTRRRMSATTAAHCSMSSPAPVFARPTVTCRGPGITCPFMALISTPVHIRVPATSANLGPGFDALGLALARHDLVEARVAGSDIRVEVAGEGAGE